MSSLKITVIGDIHAQLSLLSSALKKAIDIDSNYVVLTGDFCNGRVLARNATEKDFFTQINTIIDLLKEYKDLKVRFLLGNHDPIKITDKLTKLPHLMDIHGLNTNFGNYKVGGIGGSHKVTPQLPNKTLLFPEGYFPDLIDDFPDVEYIRKINNPGAPYLYSSVHKLYNTIFPCDILVSHTPPLLDNRQNFHQASAGLYKLIERYKPLLSVSAHIHAPKKHIEEISWNNTEKTILFNLGSLNEKKIVVISLLKEEKEIVSLKMISI
ncbi:MAG: metallophosphoesterase family protein [Candidatus Hodarchaeales archaeon]|jgi:Icc-related predicted phosphoesterase